MHNPVSSILNRAARLVHAVLLVSGVALTVHTQAVAQSAPLPAPNAFIEQVVGTTLNEIKSDPSIKMGDMVRINQIVDKFVTSYVNFQKMTRLASGRHWREATPEQRTALANAFRGTLLRTYSGAFTRVEPTTSTKVLPFRGDANADDVVVRTQLFRNSNSEPTMLDYRMEKTPEGWRIYDVNVENVWLIENYRNQFSQQINENGIDGLIQALNTRNK